MSSPGGTNTQTRGVSETLGVVVLVGMTILVTASLGVGVMIMADEEAAQTADIGFTHISNGLVIEYQDERERVSGNLYIDGPDNNVSWAELEEGTGPEDMVTDNTFVEANADNPYGYSVDEDDYFEIVYFTAEGERFVLATWNEQDELDDSPLGPDEPIGPEG